VAGIHRASHHLTYPSRFCRPQADHSHSDQASRRRIPGSILSFSIFQDRDPLILSVTWSSRYIRPFRSTNLPFPLPISLDSLRTLQFRSRSPLTTFHSTFSTPIVDSGGTGIDSGDTSTHTRIYDLRRGVTGFEGFSCVSWGYVCLVSEERCREVRKGQTTI